MKLYNITTIKDEKGCDVEKPIYELSESEVSNYKLIGSAVGPGLGFCFFMGYKHGKNFGNRLFGFRIRESRESGWVNEAYKKLGLFSKANNIGVDFYEEKSAGQKQKRSGKVTIIFPFKGGGRK